MTAVMVKTENNRRRSQTAAEVPQVRLRATRRCWIQLQHGDVAVAR